MNDKSCNSRTYTEGLDCCVNYYFKDNQCLPCKLGTYGTNCNETCPKGSFGELCGGVCEECSPEECRPDYGCPTNETETTTQRIETTHTLSTTSSLVVSSQSSKILSSSASTKVWSTDVFITELKKASQPPHVIIREQTNNINVMLIVAGVIIFLLVAILLAVVRKLWLVHSKKNYPKNEIESKHEKEGNESGVYQEINLDDTMANQIEVSGNRYNIIPEEMTGPLGSKYLEIGSKIEKELKSAYTHYQEIDNEKSSSTENNGEYLDPESTRQIHSYIEVVEPMIHRTDPSNSDQDGSSSNKSDRLEEYQDTAINGKKDISYSNELSESQSLTAGRNDTYLDVIHK